MLPSGGDMAFATARTLPLAPDTNTTVHHPLPSPCSLRRSTTLQSSRPISRGESIRPKSSRGIKKSQPMTTPEEYEALPPSIQKKYFSSVERLRIYQQAAAQQRKKQPSAKAAPSSPRHSTDSSLRPKSAHAFRSSQFLASTKPANISRSDADLDGDQAVRFLMLPEKVKRSNFTVEELQLLTASSERALGLRTLSAEQPFPRPASSRGASLDMLQTFRPSRSAQSSTLQVSDAERGGWRKDSFGADVGLHGSDIRLQESRTRQSSVTSTHSGLSQLTVPRGELGQEVRRKSFSTRRSINLAPIPLPPPTLAPAVPPLPSPTTLEHMKSTLTPEWQPSTELKSATKFYKDTEARKQVRDFLASPERFDEALEFGFPPDRMAKECSTSATPSLDAPLSSDFDCTSTDLSRSDDDDEEASLPRSPMTPVPYAGARPPGSAHKPSVDSGIDLTPSVHSGMINMRSASPDIAGREMTLRLTLTRPDLRAPEEKLYSFQRSQVSGVEVDTMDPLALQVLSVCEDHTGAHGAFATHQQSSPKGLLRVWKNIRGRKCD